MLFSFDLITDDATHAIYDRMLQDEALKFLEWRRAKVLRDDRIAPAFDAWWRQHGTTRVVPAAVPRLKADILARACELVGESVDD